jgi:hypothetical protein
LASYPGFIGGSLPSQSALATSERTVNFYKEKISTQGTQHKDALYPTPGFQTWNATPTIDLGGRAALSIDSRTFVMMGAGLYQAFTTQQLTKLATLSQDGNLAQIVYNGPTGGQLCISTGTNAYNYVIASGALTTVLTAEATQVGMLDEYFLALNQTTGKLRLSNLNDGTTWDPTQFALRSAQPDPWQAMIINAPDIWLLGEQTGDIWYDAGTSPFPLAARQGLTIPYGIAAPFSLAVTGGEVLWLTKNKDGAGLVVRANGYSPTPISTPELATALSRYQRTSTITDAEALVYQQDGHTFYVLRFPSANATWAYDLTTGEWAERGKWNNGRTDYDVWAPRVHVYAFGQHLTADASTGTLSAMDVSYGSELDGSAIRRLRRGPILIDENRRIGIRRFEVLVEPGLGLQTGQGSNPQMMFRASSDGGKTWGNERSVSVGQVGQYRRRAVVTRLGRPRLWVPEISVSDPTPWRIVDAFVNNDASSAAA